MTGHTLRLADLAPVASYAVSPILKPLAPIPITFQHDLPCNLR